MRVYQSLTHGVLLAPLLLHPGGDDPFEAGMRLYREGKYAESVEAFARAAAAAQDRTLPPIYYNKALAAFAAGDPHSALADAERAAAAAAGDLSFLFARDFLRGNVAFERSRALEKESDASLAQPPTPPVPGAQGSKPDPLALLSSAIQEAQGARDAWIEAAQKNISKSPALSSDAARRNVERAILRVEELKKKKEELEKQQKEQSKDSKDGDKNNEDKKNEKPESRPESRPQDSKPESQPSSSDDKQNQDQENKDPKSGDQKQENENNEQKNENDPQDPGRLTKPQIQQILDKLDEKEKQRQKLQKARVIRVPRDW